MVISLEYLWLQWNCNFMVIIFLSIYDMKLCPGTLSLYLLRKTQFRELSSSFFFSCHLVAFISWMSICHLNFRIQTLLRNFFPQNVEVTMMSSVDLIHVSKPGIFFRHNPTSNMGTAFASFFLIFGGSKSYTYIIWGVCYVSDLGMGKVKSWSKNWILWSVLTIVVVVRFPPELLLEDINFFDHDHNMRRKERK